MNIAVPTNDGTSISGHFGRSAAFLIFQIEDGQIQSRESRSLGQGACHQHEPGSESHSHAGILAALSGCDTVICAGMGHRAAEALRAGGITPIVVAPNASAEEAVSAFLAGTLSPQPKGFCRCHD